MPTRRRQEDAPIAFERYMSSSTYADRRPIPLNIVAEKAAGYSSTTDRRLLFWLQAMSMQPGGLFEFAAELLEAVPSFGEGASQLVPGVSWQEDYAAYLASKQKPVAGSTETAHQALIQLCINPTIDLDRFRGSSSTAPTMLEGLEKYRRAKAEELDANRVITSLGKIVRGCLDKGLATRRMIVIEGESGSGKTYEAKAWCEAHPGEARFVELTGITHRTGFFQKIGAALGIGICQQASSKLQARIEGVLASTGLMLVIDEAHYLWPQHRRNHSSPELVDWVDTALVNSGVPVALIATDQFSALKTRVEKQTGWTAAQFIHRAFRFTKLPPRPTRTDLESVTTHLLSMTWLEEAQDWISSSRCAPAPKGAIKAIVGYAGANLLPLPSVRSIVEEARFLAHEGNGRDIVVTSDVAEALAAQTSSDVAIRKAFDPHSKKAIEPVPPIDLDDPAAEPAIALPGGRNFSSTAKEQMSRNSPALPTNPAFRRAQASGLASA